MKDVRDMAKDYRRGDTVFLINPRDGSLVRITGLVSAVHRGIGCLDVEFPWGNQRVQADEIVRMFPGGDVSPPPSMDTSYSGWDITKSRLDDRTQARVASLAHRWINRVYELRAKVAQHFASGRGRYAALTQVLQEYPHARTNEVNAAIQHVYDYMPKQALYWNAPGRQYRPTRSELESGSFACPRCKEPMGKAIYRKGARLYSCVNCLFMIAPEDIFDPEEVRAASFAHEKLAAALGDKSDWVVAHAPGLAAAYHGKWGMAFRDGAWRVLGTDGNVMRTVASPKEAFDVIMQAKEAGARVNNDAEDLVRSVMDTPDRDVVNNLQTELQETAEERGADHGDDLGDLDLGRMEVYRAASNLASRLISAAQQIEAENLDAADAQAVLAEADKFLGAGA